MGWGYLFHTISMTKQCTHTAAQIQKWVRFCDQLQNTLGLFLTNKLT